MAEPRKRILVADDEITSRLLLQAAIEKSGHEAVLAIEGEDALRQFQARPCDLVMLDVEMPGLNGYQACAALRAAAGQELPIVMVTGMDDLESIDRAYQAGATDFMAKPINWSLLGHRVKYLLRASRTLHDLHLAHEKILAILEAIPDLMFEIDLEGHYLEFHSPRTELLARPVDAILGRTVAEVLPPDAAQAVMSALQEAHATGISNGIQFHLIPQDGHLHWFELSASRKATEAGSIPRFIVLSRDITDRKEAESRIARLAYYDTLTGLPNRQFFLERLGREVDRAHHSGEKLAVLFMDLDGFKHVNDTLGHSAGDQILRWAADRLRENIRPSDLISRVQGEDPDTDFARLGGDEFTLLLPAMKHGREALEVGHRICEHMRLPFMLDGREVVLTSSIGIAIFPDDGDSPETLVRCADMAMYFAKEQGRDNCQLYNQILSSRAVRRLNLESNLHLALGRHEFSLVYQPQLDIGSGRIHSVEALIRWKHPEQGMVSPGDFIPLAEESGLIVPISEWVLRSACAEAAGWHAAGHPVRVAVNLSVRNFKEPGLVHTVRSILAETGLPPALLELEITEGALMEDSSTTLGTLKILRESGVNISLDDFGTGFSCMSYLMRLPIHNLKIDKSFIQGLPAAADSLAIVRIIISLAKTLGFTVTAEGVETLEQAQILKSLACDLLQGFYFSKPLPAADIPAKLRECWPLGASVEHPSTSEFSGL